MTPTPSSEARVAALIAAYADRAVVAVDPIAMTRLAASGPGPVRWSAGSRIAELNSNPSFLVLVIGLLVAMLAVIVGVGSLLLRRDPITAIPNPVPVIAHYARIHAGYTFVYADGRVIWSHDGGPHYERRLTQEGVDLVRSGAISEGAFLVTGPGMRVVVDGEGHLHGAVVEGQSEPSLPDRWWAEQEWRRFEPSAYAVCFRTGDSPLAALDAVPLLPAAAQALLRGKERTYVPDSLFESGPPTTAEQCSEVGPADARTLGDAIGGWTWTWGLDSAAELSILAPARPPFCVLPACPNGPVSIPMSVVAEPVLPHGTWVVWGG